jgi:hypothetical protein
MRKGMWLVTLVVAGVLGQVSAVICDPDQDPAPFRGGPNTTLQSWLFSTEANPDFPDVKNNPYGDPRIDLEISDPQGPAFYFPQDGDHQGVWLVNRSYMEMIVTVPNNPAKNASKDIWLQITYRSDEMGAIPGIIVFPDGGDTNIVPSYAMDMVKTNPLDPANLAGYYHAVYKVSLPYNPVFEKIIIRPRDCLLFVDCITIETQCIPEPMTLVLLGLGGLMLRKRIA